MFHIPVIGICAHSSGMGKTTLLTALLPVLTARGYRVSVIKQTHADFDLDRPGKDSYRMREAGASQVLLSSPTRWALLTEHDVGMADARLLGLIGHLDADMSDLVLVEGFREAPIPKIEVYRVDCEKPPLAEHDPYIIAVASDSPIAAPVPLIDLDKIKDVADFITGWLAGREPSQEWGLTRRPQPCHYTVPA
jgi:molybdopterin-guanine dinucleotide biosynthesis protein B